jgi:glucose-1-phosphate adenylyltransferase
MEDVVMMGADFYESGAQMADNLLHSRPSLGVGYNCRIRGAIIDKNARIGDNVTLSPDGKPDGTYAHGVIIRDGVMVVPKGGIVPNGTVI